MPYPLEKKKKIKELVINQIWKNDQPKSGDEYRSLCKQIDNFLKFMDDKTTPLYWMPIDIMTESEIAQIICSYVERNNRDKSNRLLLFNLDYEGIRYNYFHFAAHTPSNIQSEKSIYETSPELKDVQPLKIREVLSDIHSIWKNNLSDKEKLSITEKWLVSILQHILQEKEQYKVMGFRFTNPIYIDNYIDVVSHTVKLVVNNLIIFNNNSTDKKANLKIIRDYLEDELIHINKYVKNSRASFQKLRAKFSSNNNDDMLSLYFAMYMQRKSIYDEIRNISMAIKDDLPNFELPSLEEYKYKKVSECSTQFLKKAMFAKGVNDFSDKLDRTISFMKKYVENGERKCEDIQAVQIMFTAIYHSKVQYQKKTMATLVRNMLNENFNSTLEAKLWLFLNTKIEQAKFLKWELRDEFPIYMEVLDRLNQLLLLPYSTWDDAEAYKRIYHIGYDFLYPFAFKEQYGLNI